MNQQLREKIGALVSHNNRLYITVAIGTDTIHFQVNLKRISHNAEYHSP